MRYILMSHVNSKDLETMPPEQIDEAMGRFVSFTQALAQSGVLRSAERLGEIDTATTVRNRDGQTLLTDGPYAELAENFGGYWIVETPDLDAALKHAAECPGADFGAVEVRPIVDMG